MKDKKKENKNGNKNEKKKDKIICREAVNDYRQREFLALDKMFSKYDWMWLATLTVEHGLSSYAVEEKIESWARKLQTTEHVQVGYLGVMCEKNHHLHVHLLMVGQGTHNGKILTLGDVNPRKWSDRWPFFAKIEDVEDPYRASRYVASHKLKSKCDKCEIIDYNKKCLQKYEII